MIGRVLKLLATALSLLGPVLVFSSETHGSKPVPEVERVAVNVDGSAIGKRLGEAVRFRTISAEPPAPVDAQAFEGFISWLARRYRALHYHAERTLINDYTVLLKWTGRNPDLQPILLAAHYDVVPLTPGTEELWEHAPFEGVVASGMVYGRGALTNKSVVICICEAAERLIREGFRPERTIYLSFAHDEEVGGEQGAASVALHLLEQGVQLAWTLDEGSFLVTGPIPPEVAVSGIEVARKSPLTLKLTAQGEDGDSFLVYGPIISSLGVAVAATDTSHYSTVADDSYRIVPMILTPELLMGSHGPNESVSIGNLEVATAAYKLLIQSGAG